MRRVAKDAKPAIFAEYDFPAIGVVSPCCFWVHRKFCVVYFVFSFLVSYCGLLPVELDCRLKQGYNSPYSLSESSCHSSSSGGHIFCFVFPHTSHAKHSLIQSYSLR